MTDSPTSNQNAFVDEEDVLNFLGELMADYVDREQHGKADLVGDAIKLITARAAEPPNGNLLQQIAHWANQIPEAGPIRALLAETKDESLPEIEQLGTVTMKCKPATKLEPLPPVETSVNQGGVHPPGV